MTIVLYVELWTGETIEMTLERKGARGVRRRASMMLSELAAFDYVQTVGVRYPRGL